MKTHLTTACLAALMAVSAVHAADITLFGTPIKDADRNTLRAAIKKGGATATREENKYWCDLYDAKAALEGAEDLSACYESKTNRFAAATYSFPAFMDVNKVREVVDMVSRKYGKPSKVTGSYGMGEVTAIWKQGGVQIEVSRGWPDTTVILGYYDNARYAAMKNEMKAEENAQRSATAKRQSQAF